MATPLHRLSHTLATRIVTEWRKRLESVFSLSCNFVYCPHDFVSTWNTISIERKPPFSAFATPSEAIAPLLVLREAVEIWHAVSCCAGFGFDENPTFWEHALQIKFESRWPTVPLAAMDSFPIVLIHWDPMLAFLPYRASGDVESTDMNSPAWSAFTSAPILSIYAHLQSRSHVEPGVMLLGLQLEVKAAPHTLHFKWLHQLLERTPEPIAVEFVSHPLASDQVMAQRGMMPLLENVMGKMNGPAGRLALLDLSSGVQLTKLGAVCSLLPHSRSIVEVRLKVQNRLGLLWVAYAMFHPSSRQTNWTHLCLEDQSANLTRLQAMRCFLGNRNGSEIIQYIATKLKQGECSPAPEETEPSGTPRGYVIRTAVLTKRTNVYTTNKPPVSPCTSRKTANGNTVYSRELPGTVHSRALGGYLFLSETAERTYINGLNAPAVSQTVLVILPKDTQVELAEDDTSDLPDKVHVIVPGCGLGVVPKAHLKKITTQEYPGRRASCISALHYQSYDTDKAIVTEVLQELVPGIRHVRVNPPQAFLERPVPQENKIESIDCYLFTAQSSEWLQRLRRLRSLGFSCTADQLRELLSAIRSAFTGDAARSRTALRALRLTVNVPRASSDIDWRTTLTLLSTTIGKKLTSLRVFEIAFRNDCPPDDIEVGQFTAQLPVSQPGLAMGKLTFLWALRTWRPQCAAALDSYVLAMIFGFCGRSMERVLVTRLPLAMRFSLGPGNEDV